MIEREKMEYVELTFYEKRDGSLPVVEFLDSLPKKMRAKALREMDILKEYGNELREPYTKYLEDGIFELRIKLGSDISRILYFFYDGRNIVLTNGFIKKTWKTPRGEIEKAKMYRKDYFHRTGRL